MENINITSYDYLLNAYNYFSLIIWFKFKLKKNDNIEDAKSWLLSSNRSGSGDRDLVFGLANNNIKIWSPLYRVLKMQI